ncbi:PstS family phosphate ABC transporter substrate-binding protein [Gloeocapsopsis dulcis]|uniref:Phosphate ABC transporter substrate-binding protein n=1 Tax=Gloeocapsopsis dulcis AAB1 = 1H9 TaxID=1433147 RepID=A0A6N8FYF8_9CHRO|nr:substrate-binding domain-containing protein [Gloeocapsopsis dulcis]MUL37167.1 phosphate ABC transporter substrate-binding protein [Gloeocapsopsis dulcis AAB1 = 1H9]WNN90227.1 substrate-binding domain-containing protein [Gloeocapsopsis dulcis]
MTGNGKQTRNRLSKDVVLLIRGLIIGKVLTLVVIGGVLWWLRPRLFVSNDITSTQNSGVASVASDVSNFQSVTAVPTGTFNYGGSPAWAAIRQLVDAQIQNARPELQLRYVSPDEGIPSSRTGIQMLLDGKIDIAQTSRPLTAAESAIAKQRGIALEQHPVGVDGVAVAVNHSLTVPGLTTEQLRQIYQGTITNWSQVGGPNLPIVPFSRPLEDADTLLFAQSQSSQFESQVQYVPTTTEALRQVSNTPGGIYYASARTIVPQCSVKTLPLGETTDQLIAPYRQPLVQTSECPVARNQVNTAVFESGEYPITYNLFVITKQNQGREQQVGEAYTNLLLSQQGQKAIEQVGFAPVSSENLARQ